MFQVLICPHCKSEMLHGECSVCDSNAPALVRVIESKPASPCNPQSIPEIFTRAATLIIGPRREAYGPAEESFEAMAAVWSQVFKQKLAPEQRFSASDVALAMIAFKLMREANKADAENLVDLCGYAALKQQLEEARAGAKSAPKPAPFF